MSSAESFISGHSMHTDSVTNGLNPIYNSVSGSTQYIQCEYDEIKDGHSNILAPTLPNQTITTPNTMYASKGESLQHHKMNLDQVYQLASIPEENEYQEKESHCKCSADAVICVMSILSMLLSGQCSIHMFVFILQKHNQACFIDAKSSLVCVLVMTLL